MRDLFPDGEITVDKTNFSLKNKNLNLEDTKTILNKVQQSAGDLAGIATFMDINTNNKNYIFLKKYFYKIDLDLQELSDLGDLELNFKIINPNKAVFDNKTTLNLKFLRII